MSREATLEAILREVLKGAEAKRIHMTKGQEDRIRTALAPEPAAGCLEPGCTAPTPAGTWCPAHSHPWLRARQPEPASPRVACAACAANLCSAHRPTPTPGTVPPDQGGVDHALATQAPLVAAPRVEPRMVTLPATEAANEQGAYCGVCGWRKFGADSWDGLNCKCGPKGKKL